MILRRIGGVIAGLITAWLVVSIAEAAAHKIYPPPRGLDMTDFNQVKQFVASLPVSALLIVLAGWLVGTFLGTWLAARISQNRVPAYIVGGLLLAAGIANAVLIPQPIWFSIISFAVYIGMTLLGARVGAAGSGRIPIAGETNPLSS